MPKRVVGLQADAVTPKGQMSGLHSMLPLHIASSGEGWEARRQPINRKTSNWPTKAEVVLSVYAGTTKNRRQEIEESVGTTARTQLPLQ